MDLKTFAIWSMLAALAFYSAVAGEQTNEPGTASSPCKGDELSVPQGCVSPPVPVKQPKPKYPKEAKKAKLQGKVVLEVLVREDGSVGRADVANATPAGKGFEDPAAEAVRKWMFKPAELAGKPVEVVINVLVDFKLH